jgi:uncharacterized protein (DUF2249 family)
MSTENGVHTLDLRQMPPPQRHRRILEVWASLQPGETLRIVNDHEPKPLYYQFRAEYADQHTWEYEQQGPLEWVVRIQRV